jgi:ABC-type multidrug transport system ATPase subunit
VTSYELNRFSFAFDTGQELLREINTSLKVDEITIITGKNGAGKSTLCRILTGLTKNYVGSVKLFGKELNQLKPTELMKNILFIKQDVVGNIIGMTPDEDLVVWQNKFSEKDTPEKEQKRVEALESLALSKYSEEPVWNLSFGLKRRVMLSALSLFMEKYWIVDEPIAGLDTRGISLFQDLLKTKKLEKSGAIIVTHRGDIFNGIADRHLHIDDGQLIEMDIK